MCYQIPFDEDACWEQIREKYENPPRHWYDEPIYESDWLFLEEEQDDIEAENGCAMSAMYEADLMDIVEQRLGVEPVSARWDEGLCGIEYRYVPAPEYAYIGGCQR